MLRIISATRLTARTGHLTMIVNGAINVPVHHEEETVMAKLVKVPKGKEFQFKPSRSGGGNGKYNWDEWLNGQTWMLEQSVGDKNDIGGVENVTEKRDYDIPTNYMPAKLKLAARKQYKVVQISRTDIDGERLKDALIIKARDMDADERAGEDLLRAEEKSQAEAKKASKSKKDKSAGSESGGDEDSGDEADVA